MKVLTEFIQQASLIEVHSLLYLLIVLFFSISCIFLLTIFIRKNKKRIRAYRNKKLKIKSDVFLNHIMFDEQESEELNEIKKVLFSSKYNRQFLISEIQNIHKHLSGDIADKLGSFYTNSTLIKLSLEKLKTKIRHKIIEGIGELTELNEGSCMPYFESLLSDQNDHVWKNYLLLSIIQSNPDKGLQIILNTNIYLSDWQQMNIIQLMDRQGYHDSPGIDQWSQKNASLIVFGCRLMRHSQSYDKASSLIKLLRIDNDKIKIECLRTISALCMDLTENFLLSLYPSSSPSVKKEILNALLIFNNPATIQFLKRIVREEPYELQLVALKGICNTNNWKDELDELLSWDNSRLMPIVNHVRDRRI